MSRISPNLTEPFQFSSHTSPASSSKAAKAGDVPVLRVQRVQGEGKAAQAAVITVGGDGVHLIDAATQTPLQSFTLGPSFAPSHPATSVVSADGVRRTYAPVAGAKADKQRVLLWAEADGSGVGGQADKSEVELPQALHSLHSLSSHLFVAHPSSALSLASAADLGIASTLEPAASGAVTLAVSVRGGVNEVIQVLRVGEEVRIRVVVLDGEELRVRGEAVVPDTPPEIQSVSISTSHTHIHLLSTTASVHSYTLVTAASTPFITALPALPLRDLSPLSLLPASPSSHILIAGLSPKHEGELVLTLWDATFSSLLSEHTFPLPSSTPIPTLALAPFSDTQAFLALSAVPSGNTKTRSVVLAIPYTCPSTSSLLSSLGRSASTSKWVAPSVAAPAVAAPAALEEKLAQLSNRVVSSLANGNVTQARKWFDDWVQEETKRLREASERERQRYKEAAYQPTEEVVDSDGEPTPAQPPKGDLPPPQGLPVKPDLPTALVGPIVQAIFSAALTLPADPASTAEPTCDQKRYAAEIIGYLIERCAVTDGMAARWGGILRALRACGDWRNVDLAVRHVADLTEDSLIDCLATVLRAHPVATAADAMGVDAAPAAKTASVPSFPEFLHAVTGYNASAASLRRALHARFTDVDEVLRIMDVLDGWLVSWEDRGWTGNVKARRRAKSKAVIVNEASGDLSAPPLDDTARLLQTLLDTFFPALLHHPPAHATLERIATNLARHLQVHAEWAGLRAPLEVYTRGVKERGATAHPDEPKRSKRVERREANNLNVGVYGIESFALE